MVLLWLQEHKSLKACFNKKFFETFLYIIYIIYTDFYINQNYEMLFKCKKIVEQLKW